MKIKILTLLFAIVISFCFCIPSAAEAIDFDKNGSISITIQYKGETVDSGSFTLFHIADLYWNNGEYAFEYTERFENCDIGFDKLDSEATAQEYAEYVTRSSAIGNKELVGEYGAAVFTDLNTGLYLILQEDNADGYHKVSPFLITLPIKNEEGWVYEIDASPKVELERFPAEQPPETDDPKIPQTGQLKWPVPILAISGIIVFTVGWVICFTSRKKS